MSLPNIHPSRQAGAYAAIGFWCVTILVSGGCRSVDKEDGRPAQAAAAADRPASNGPDTGSVPAGRQSPGSTESPGKYGAFQSIFTNIAKKAVPSVVSISMERTVNTPQHQSPFEFFFGPDPFGGEYGGPQGRSPGHRKETGMGSGFITDIEGHILTNNHVVGINTAIYSQSGGYQGIGFAIPVNLARNIMESLIKTGKVTRGWLEVSIQPVTQDMAGVLGLKSKRGAPIGDVVSGGPADKAGLRRGDVIVTLEGRESGASRYPGRRHHRGGQPKAYFNGQGFAGRRFQAG